MTTQGPYQFSLRIRMLRKGEVLFGSGISLLLIKTDELGSLHLAAQAMGMSYRKALKLISQAEGTLGKPLLTKVIGGAGGGGSALTAFAKELAYRFNDMEEKVFTYLETLCADYFDGSEL